MPFTGKSYEQIVKERKFIQKMAASFGLELQEQFLAIETKQKFEKHAYGPLFIAEKDHRLIKNSDILIADYHGHSIGRDCEIAIAKEVFDKRIISVVPDPHMQNHPWIRLYSDYIVSSQDEAFSLAKKLYSFSLSSEVSKLSRKQKDTIDIQVDELAKKDGNDAVVNLFPTELNRRWKNLFGKDYKKVLDYCFKPLPKTLRVNTLKTNIQKFKKIALKYQWKLDNLGFSSTAFRLPSNLRPKFGEIPEHQQGLFYVQELASMIPVFVLNPKPGEKVLDIAAAPGSKTTQAAQLMENKGQILANDISSERLDVLKNAIKRLGIKIIKTNLGDGIKLGEIHKNKFDKVLVDVPCTNEGILRYKAHKFFEWNLLLMYHLTRDQRELIKSGFEALKVGGTLVYSTCSYAPEENEQVVDHLLKTYPNADITEIMIKGIKTRKGLTKWEHLDFDKRLSKTARVFPQDNDSIGFYVAKIIKNK